MTKENLRIVFFGTSDFGCPAIDTLLLNGFNIVGVVTKPDFYNMRKKRLEPTPIKQKALEEGMPVLEAKDMNSKDFQASLGALNGNVFIVVAFQMIPEAVYSMAKYGTFNIHASSLPDYRGAAPINWAIANGENRIGMTSFFINDKVDEGDIICQTSVPNYSNRNFTEMYKILSTGVCGALCCQTLNLITEFDGKPPLYKQNESDAKHKAPKLNRWNTQIDFTKSIKEIFNFIKAFSDKPGAWCVVKSKDKCNEKALKILKAEVISFGGEKKGDTGKLTVSGDDILLFASDGCLKITSLQLEGSKVMTPREIINGYDIESWELI